MTFDWNSLVSYCPILTSTIAKQSMILYASQLALACLGLMINIVNTRSLGAFNFGVYSFCLSVLGFTVLFFEFGLFSAGSRLIALCKNEKNTREYIGALLLLSAGVGVLYSLFIFSISFFIDGFFNTNVGWILRVLSPILLIYPFQSSISQICQGKNSIKELSVYTILPSLLYLLSLFFVIIWYKLTPTLSLVLSFLSLVISSLFLIRRLKPLCSSLKGNVRTIFEETKTYGFYVYTSRLMGLSTLYLDKILLSYFINTTSAGFYYLANVMTFPIRQFPTSLATSSFKKFTDVNEIPKRVFLYTILWLTVSCLLLLYLAEPIIMVFFSDNYMPVVPLVFPLTLGAFFNGMLQPYNFFLSAKGKGQYLRNIALLHTITSLAGYLLFIPRYGPFGAAYVNLITLMINYSAHFYYYNKTICRNCN